MRRGTVYALMALHVVFSAVNYVLAKFATKGFPSAGSLTMARAAASAILMLALTGTAIPWPRFSGRDWLRVAALGFLLVPLNQYLFIRGLKDTAPGHAALLYAMTPLGVLLLQSAIARRFPAAPKTIGVLLAIVGVLVVMRPWSVDDPRFKDIRVGDAWIALGAVVWVVYTVAAAPLMREHDPRTVTAWNLILGAAFLVPFCGTELVATDLRGISAEAWVGFASLVLLASCVMMLLWNKLLRHLEPVEVSVATNAQPIATAGLTALLAFTGHPVADTDIGIAFWTGTALVVAGVLLAQRRGPRDEAARTQPGPEPSPQ